MVARVARLRRLVALTDDSLPSRALEAGYASKAHVNDEVRRLTGNHARPIPERRRAHRGVT
jgi:methylphosphotriester-DNA--protein-cysteine methyltransferase